MEEGRVRTGGVRGGGEERVGVVRGQFRKYKGAGGDNRACEKQSRYRRASIVECDESSAMI